MSLRRVYIDIPELDPRPFGLTSVADISDPGDVHVLGGFEYEIECGYGSGFAVEPCNDATASFTNAGTTPWPATVTVTSDIAGSYDIDWGDGTGHTVTVITQGQTGYTTAAHNYTTTTAKTITIVGPSGYGTRTITVPATNIIATYTANKVALASGAAWTNVLGEPVTVYARRTCRPIGLDQATRHKRAMDSLIGSESWAYEKAMLARYLMTTATDVSGAPTTPKRAIALLENYAAKVYKGRPTIHLDPFTAQMAVDGGAVERRGTHLETGLGSYVAVGAGYADPATIIPATVQAYVTGAVRIRRGKAVVTSDNTPSISGTTVNDIDTYATRQSVLGVECFVARAQVTTA